MTGVEVFVIALTAGIGAALSSAVGLGGGVLLLAVMLGFMDPLEAVPVHAALQIVANGWRGYVLRTAVDTTVLRPFMVLLVPGAIVGLLLAEALPVSATQILIAVFALLASWWPAALDTATKLLGEGRRAFVSLGAISGLLQVPVGAIGPIIAPVIRRSMTSRTATVATFSLCQMLGHLVKVTLFVIVGFMWLDWWEVIVLGSITSIVGTWLGAKVLKRESEKVFGWLFRVALTLVAFSVIVLAF